MASIRVRLTLWNGGILLAVLVAVALAGYVLLRSALLSQLDRALGQQVSAATFAARSLTPSPTTVEGSTVGDRAASIVADLEAHGFLVTRPPGTSRVLVTSPIRIDEEDEHETPAEARRAAMPDIDWPSLSRAIADARDDDDAVTVAGARAGSRVRIKAVSMGRDTLTIVATQSLRKIADLLRTARSAALIALPSALLLALAVGYALARRALAPIASMTAHAQGIGSHNVHERLRVENADDELGQLATTINGVLERLDSALEQQRRFTADASHELRTPLALIRAEADVALAGTGLAENASADGELRGALTSVRDAGQRLTRIVNDLLMLARADAGQQVLEHTDVALDQLVLACVRDMRLLSQPKQLQWHTHVASSMNVRGDAELLRRAIDNLLDNAIKFSPTGGAIRVALTRITDGVELTVQDDGPGIDPQDAARIFERFYRADSSRTRSKSGGSTGAGLGLAIAQEIVQRHGGQLRVRADEVTGSTFALTLPG